MTTLKTPLVSLVRLARIDGSQIVPTCITYDGKRPYIGIEAKEKCADPVKLVEDFKIDLGKHDPDSTVRRPSTTQYTPRFSLVGVAKDFFEETLKKLDGWLVDQNLAKPTRILVAEPLSLGGSDVANEAWLSNYRKAVRKALSHQFSEVGFLPEPFAVFQYYKYGYRHPQVDSRKHIVLVLDFGGGTFDVSIIETTRDGEISKSGSNSRPLGAKSEQVGGFYINRLIAEQLLFTALRDKNQRQDLRAAIKFFNDNKNLDEAGANSIPEQQRAFFANYRKLLNYIEKAKIEICRSILNWDLRIDLTGAHSVSIPVPCDPFKLASDQSSVRLEAETIRKIFEEQIWRGKLKNAIMQTIERARQEIGNQDISLVLLSGGSSNIRWLAKLLPRDLNKQLGSAQILELTEDFQEIVAKGLATECARKSYNGGEGDFKSVTYNRLCLLLRSDDGEVEFRRFKPVAGFTPYGNPDEIDLEDSILLPSASRLSGFIDKPLKWKVRLGKPPKHTLHYFFTRSSLDPNDLESLYNIADTRVATPKGVHFQQSIEVELTLREKGTAEPRFIYGRDHIREGTIVEGRPFFIDMTAAIDETPGETYLGFDFGSSASALSIVNSRDVQLIEQRTHSAEWLEISELVGKLPYPASSPLARFASELDQDRRQERGREAVEAMLTMIAYIALSERWAEPKLSTGFFKILEKRSAGPLWGLLRQLLAKSPSNCEFCGCFKEIMDGLTYERINDAITNLAKPKHGKVVSIDYITVLTMLGNTLSKALRDHVFGVFENVGAKRFERGKFTGVFRQLSGFSQTFIKAYSYEGTTTFSSEEVFIVNISTGSAISLSPLYIWGLSSSTNQEIDLYEYDSTTKNQTFSFKAVQPREEYVIEEGGSMNEVWRRLIDMRAKDQQSDKVDGVDLSIIV